MPSPRLQEPAIPKDSRSPAQDSTAYDLFQTAGPAVVEVGTNIITNEYQDRAASAIQQEVIATQGNLRTLDNFQGGGEAKAGAVSEYATRVSTLDRAVAQGKIGANSAKNRVNALTREYSRRFPAFASEFTGRNSALESAAETAVQGSREVELWNARAEEFKAVRARMQAMPWLNPDNPSHVQEFMNLEKEIFMTELDGKRAAANGVRTAHQRAQYNAMFQQNLAGSLQDVTTAANKELIRVFSNQDPVARGGQMTGARLKIAQRFDSLIEQVALDPSLEPEDKRIYTDMLKNRKQTMLEIASLETLSKEIENSVNILKGAATSRVLVIPGVATSAALNSVGLGPVETVDALSNLLLREQAIKANFIASGYTTKQADQAFNQISAPLLAAYPGLASAGVAGSQHRIVADAKDAQEGKPSAAGARAQAQMWMRAGERLPTEVLLPAWKVAQADGNRLNLWELSQRIDLSMQVYATPEFKREVLGSLGSVSQEIGRAGYSEWYITMPDDREQWYIMGRKKTSEPFELLLSQSTVLVPATQSSNVMERLTRDLGGFDAPGGMTAGAPGSPQFVPFEGANRVPARVRDQLNAALRLHDLGVPMPEFLKYWGERFRPFAELTAPASSPPQ